MLGRSLKSGNSSYGRLLIFVPDRPRVRRQCLIFVLCATGFASASPNGIGTSEALEEPVARQRLPVTMH